MSYPSWTTLLLARMVEPLIRSPSSSPQVSPTRSRSGSGESLKNINHYKAPGPDNITGRLLKEGAIELSPIFTLLFNSTLHQGKIPSPWKQAHVAPVHKKNSRHDPANYRPISLTSVTCKIIEHIIYSQVINHLDSNGILTDKQFGFRKRHSCETQLLITVQDLATAD